MKLSTSSSLFLTGLALSSSSATMAAPTTDSSGNIGGMTSSASVRFIERADSSLPSTDNMPASPAAVAGMLGDLGISSREFQSRQLDIVSILEGLPVVGGLLDKVLFILGIKTNGASAASILGTDQAAKMEALVSNAVASLPVGAPISAIVGALPTGVIASIIGALPTGALPASALPIPGISATPNVRMMMPGLSELPVSLQAVPAPSGAPAPPAPSGAPSAPAPPAGSPSTPLLPANPPNTPVVLPVPASAASFSVPTLPVPAPALPIPAPGLPIGTPSLPISPGPSLPSLPVGIPVPLPVQPPVGSAQAAGISASGSASASAKVSATGFPSSSASSSMAKPTTSA